MSRELPQAARPGGHMAQKNLYSFTARSRNAKTGPIPVTYSPRVTCPTSCSLRNNGCYAEAEFYTRLHWNRLDAGATGMSFDALCEKIRALPPGTLWRHNIAGDLPGVGDNSNTVQLKNLLRAAKHTRGFTYTHKWDGYARNLSLLLGSTIAKGLTVNLSCEDVAKAEALARSGVPVVLVVPHDVTENFKTPKGVQVVICPATQREDVTCMTCGLCANATRQRIIAFPAHGRDTKEAEQVITLVRAKEELWR